MTIVILFKLSGGSLAKPALRIHLVTTVQGSGGFGLRRIQAKVKQTSQDMSDPHIRFDVYRMVLLDRHQYGDQGACNLRLTGAFEHRPGPT
jgi:Tfp pilus assembly protein PilN